jgi:hypothetical protein
MYWQLLLPVTALLQAVTALWQSGLPMVWESGGAVTTS